MALSLFAIENEILVWTFGVGLSTGLAQKRSGGARRVSLSFALKEIINSAIIVAIGLILFVLRVPYFLEDPIFSIS